MVERIGISYKQILRIDFFSFAGYDWKFRGNRFKKRVV